MRKLFSAEPNVATHERNRAGLVAVFLALLLVINLALVVVLTGCEKPKTNNYDDEARRINEAVNIANDAPTRPTTRQFDETGSEIDIENVVGVVENYVILDELFVLDIPEQLVNKLDDGVMDYLNARLNDVNNAIKDAENAIEQELYRKSEIYNSYFTNNLIRASFSIDSRWVSATIDLALVAINLGLAAARSVAWLFGKKSVIGFIRKFIPAVLRFFMKIVKPLVSISNKIQNIMNNSSDNLLMRWFSIGGVVANIIDMFDSDGYNGSITFVW